MKVFIVIVRNMAEPNFDTKTICIVITARFFIDKVCDFSGKYLEDVFVEICKD